MKRYGYNKKLLNELSVGGESIDDVDDDNFELEDPDNDDETEDEDTPPEEQGEGNPAEDDADIEDPDFGATDDDVNDDFTPVSDNPDDNLPPGRNSPTA